MTGPHDAARGRVAAERIAAQRRTQGNVGTNGRDLAVVPAPTDDGDFFDDPAPPPDPYIDVPPPTAEPGHQTPGGTTNDDALQDRFVDGASFVLDEPATIPALWGDGKDVLWAEGESLMIAGPMGLGKTTLAGLLIRAQLGLATDVLARNVTPRPGRILLLAMDRPRQIARSLARQFDENDRRVLAERLVVWRGPPPADIARNPTLLNALADMAGAHTVYVDSVKDAALGLSEDEVGAGYNRARQHLLVNGREMADLHHTTKRGAGGGPPTSVVDIYGSAWITNGAGSIILLSGDPGDPIVDFKHVRAPAEQVGPYQLLHDPDAGTLSVSHETNIVELVRAKGVDGLTARDAARALFSVEKPTAAQIERARRRLGKLVTEAVLVGVDGRLGGAKGHGESAWFSAERRPSND